MSIKNTWKSLNATEKLLLGTAIILIILIIARWDRVSDELAEGFKRIFEKHSIN
jgi:hypothetical protein